MAPKKEIEYKVKAITKNTKDLQRFYTFWKCGGRPTWEHHSVFHNNGKKVNRFFKTYLKVITYSVNTFLIQEKNLVLKDDLIIVNSSAPSPPSPSDSLYSDRSSTVVPSPYPSVTSPYPSVSPPPVFVDPSSPRPVVPLCPQSQAQEIASSAPCNSHESLLHDLGITSSPPCNSHESLLHDLGIMPTLEVPTSDMLMNEIKELKEMINKMEREQMALVDQKKRVDHLEQKCEHLINYLFQVYSTIAPLRETLENAKKREPLQIKRSLPQTGDSNKRNKRKLDLCCKPPS